MHALLSREDPVHAELEEKAEHGLSSSLEVVPVDALLIAICYGGEVEADERRCPISIGHVSKLEARNRLSSWRT